MVVISGDESVTERRALKTWLGAAIHLEREVELGVDESIEPNAQPVRSCSQGEMINV